MVITINVKKKLTKEEKENFLINLAIALPDLGEEKLSEVPEILVDGKTVEEWQNGNS